MKLMGFVRERSYKDFSQNFLPSLEMIDPSFAYAAGLEYKVALFEVIVKATTR